jgi:hypothetical protein
LQCLFNHVNTLLTSNNHNFCIPQTKDLHSGPLRCRPQRTKSACARKDSACLVRNTCLPAYTPLPHIISSMDEAGEIEPAMPIMTPQLQVSQTKALERSSRANPPSASGHWPHSSGALRTGRTSPGDGRGCCGAGVPWPWPAACLPQSAPATAHAHITVSIPVIIQH